MDEGCVKSKLVQTVSTGYITGVLRSPNLLASLCKQYFHRYDLNADGFLCLHEVECLARELHASLGLPLDTINEKNLKESISGFDENGRLTKESFPSWFRKELEYTIEKSEQLKVVKENEHNGMRRRVSSQHFGSFSGDIREQRPEYLLALAKSPQILKSICSQYFKRYDLNQDGFIQAEEALKVTQDLNECLGLPSDSNLLAQLQDTLPQFSRAKRASLTADEFPDWFQGSLQERCSSSNKCAVPLENLGSQLPGLVA